MNPLSYEAFLQQYVLAHTQSDRPCITNTEEAKWLVARADEAWMAIKARNNQALSSQSAQSNA